MPTKEMPEPWCYLSNLPNYRPYLAREVLPGLRIEPVLFDGVPIKTIPEVRKIYFNNKHTTIEWTDGVKTTVGCAEGQEFDEYAGFAAAVLKRLFGTSKSAIRYMDERKVVQPEPTKKVKRAPAPTNGETEAEKNA